MPNVKYTEDWAIVRKRHKILAKPRKYTLTVYLYNTDGDHMVETIDPPKGKGLRLTQDDLSNLVYVQVNRLIKENPDQVIDLVATYINIRA